MRRSKCWRKACEALICFLSGVSHPYQSGEKRSFLHHTGSLDVKEQLIGIIIVRNINIILVE